MLHDKAGAPAYPVAAARGSRSQITASTIDDEMSSMAAVHPDYLSELIGAYGAPSQQGFGCAVFAQNLHDTE